MNFLRQSFSSISEPNSNPPQQHFTATHSERDRDASLQAAAAALPPAHAAQPTSSFDSDGEDGRAAPIPSASAVDSLRTRNRIAIEGHMDVPKDGGGILIPSRQLPTSWHVHADMNSILSMGRDFVFPGECVSIVVYVSSHDLSMPQIISPFRVAAMLEKVNLKEKESTEKGSLSVSGDSSEASLDEDKEQLAAGKVALSSLKDRSSAAEKVLMIEEHKNRSAALLHMFQNCHFFTRLVGAEEQVSKGEKFFGQSAEELDDGTVSTSSSEHKKLAEVAEPVPIVLEGADFDPRYAGGVARNARCYSFDNGDIAVVLQISVATDLKGEVVLEVLQFQQPGQVGTVSHHGNQMERTQAHQGFSNSSDQLLQWLLPLDNPPSPPLSGVAATSTSFVNSSPQRPSLTGSSGSSLFSFANIRTYSSGSSSHSAQLSSMATSQLTSTYGLEEWDRPASQRSAKGHSMGKEGLLSFRGAQLEPQRFSVHFGLEGLYVPGWRWRRKLDIVEPVAIESYIADCNTKDLICVTVENIVPNHFPEISVVIDSISIVCQTPRSSSIASAVPLACVEVGEDHKLPGLSLRPGEQHSFILKPSNSSSRPSAKDKVKAASISSLHDVQPSTTSFQGSVKQKGKDHGLGSFQDAGNYVVVVSCRCSHTESRLHFKHPIKWQPRTPRDLLLSVSLESVSKPELSTTGSLPTFVPKVVTIQATNLTSDSLHLTLLAPSSKYSGSSLPLPAANISGLPRISSFMSFHEKKEWPIAKNKENVLDQDKGNSEVSPSGRPSSLQRSLSLPPAKPIESIMGITPRVVKERAISAADIAAENSSARTHLWLQSIIPLGYVPPQSTTAIRCELLPLTDGIITLDTLHISTKDRDVYYPEQALQIHSTSSIGIGIP
ncbi:hypothetical protein GOP47_0019563 [Adiantum capillus-veneris]|uniref:Uncharacterized protein n=1 Tax=Adiantum capillus-veneris TaxID=13818 RepID=A0A9D4Z764_ADICA|nr:hypothetical protein GOP47_0019563 [Adiantum capillus-veneris]